ncbi:hypothetical protein BGZ60DRAFT_565009 [Tricladium varicosporioides]|nr:hypothetical protein BGZ60DRAFT_565009 [Hymenoscyphus varicosporioides]
MAQSNIPETQRCQALTTDRQLESSTSKTIAQNTKQGRTIAATAARGANMNMRRIEPTKTPRLKSGGITTELYLCNHVVRATKAGNIDELFKIGKFRFIRGTTLIIRNGYKVTSRRFPNQWEEVEQSEKAEEASKIGRFYFSPGSTLRYKKGDKVTGRRFPAQWEKIPPKE